MKKTMTTMTMRKTMMISIIDHGGNHRSGQPQPDAREGDEACMAVLNNFYGDGESP